MEFERYIQDVTPFNILQIIDEGLLANLLNGYSYALGAGITVVFPRELPITAANLERLNALGPRAPKSFNRLCECWRDSKACNRDDFCRSADNKIALRYWKNKYTTPVIYRCGPLRLWDMAFPLRIEQRVVGVLFGGQMIVRGGAVDWRSCLRDHYDLVDWRGIPTNDSHIDTVRTAIRTRGLSSDLQENMLRIIDGLSEKDAYYVAPDGLCQRIDEFLKFGEMTQGLLKELHRARKTASEQQLLRACSQVLAEVNLASEKDWWAACGDTLCKVASLANIRTVHLYVRYQSVYEREVPAATPEHRTPRLATRDVVNAFPAVELLNASRSGGDLLSRLGLGEGQVWGYRSQTGSGGKESSTLVVFRGSIPDERRQLLSDLCGVVCSAADIASLIFRERDADLRYRRKIRLIGHSFRTPLQSLQLNLEEITRDEINADMALRDKLRQGMKRIEDAKEDLNVLLESAAYAEERVDFLKTLKYVIKSLEPIAKKHPCAVVRRGQWPGAAKVMCTRYRLQRALTCLLDNAIKYSYCGQREDGSLFEVRLSMNLEGQYVKLYISNYGIGVPADKLSTIREYGGRSNVMDRKKVRRGTGMGLPFAMAVFEQSGGWVHLMESRPSKSATPDDIMQHHRYVTIVEAALPILKQSRT